MKIIWKLIKGALALIVMFVCLSTSAMAYSPPVEVGAAVDAAACQPTINVTFRPPALAFGFTGVNRYQLRTGAATSPASERAVSNWTLPGAEPLSWAFPTTLTSAGKTRMTLRYPAFVVGIRQAFQVRAILVPAATTDWSAVLTRTPIDLNPSC